jgi:hypothetical protein
MSAPELCPKCHRTRLPGQDACAQCGLLVTRWETYKPEVPSLEPVDKAWSDLQAKWDDDAAHEMFLELAAHFDGLDVAAALYKKRSVDDPQDTRAREGLTRAVTLAQNLYVAKARDSIAEGYNQIRKIVLIFAAVLTLVVSAWLVWAMFPHR